ncbi:4511_t:CDS:1, partial [Ambispora leptoticha]
NFPTNTLRIYNVSNISNGIPSVIRFVPSAISATPSKQDDPSKPNDQSFFTWVMVGSVIGGFVGGIAFTLMIWFLRKRLVNNASKQNESLEDSSNVVNESNHKDND